MPSWIHIWRFPIETRAGVRCADIWPGVRSLWLWHLWIPCCWCIRQCSSNRSVLCQCPDQGWNVLLPVQDLLYGPEHMSAFPRFRHFWQACTSGGLLSSGSMARQSDALKCHRRTWGIQCAAADCQQVPGRLCRGVWLHLVCRRPAACHPVSWIWCRSQCPEHDLQAVSDSFLIRCQKIGQCNIRSACILCLYRKFPVCCSGGPEMLFMSLNVIGPLFLRVATIQKYVFTLSAVFMSYCYSVAKNITVLHEFSMQLQFFILFFEEVVTAFYWLPPAPHSVKRSPCRSGWWRQHCACWLICLP